MDVQRSREQSGRGEKRAACCLDLATVVLKLMQGSSASALLTRGAG